MTYGEQVREVKKLVTERWNQGAYFSLVNGQACCCVHGAAQLVCNPEASAVYKDYSVEGGDDIVRRLVRVMLPMSSTAAEQARANRSVFYEGSASLQQVWTTRPAYIRHGSKFGNLNLHYLLGMFGITAHFNDAANTTLSKMLAVLDTCIAWVDQNESFLADN